MVCTLYSGLLAICLIYDRAESSKFHGTNFLHGPNAGVFGEMLTQKELTGFLVLSPHRVNNVSMCFIKHQ